MSGHCTSDEVCRGGETCCGNRDCYQKKGSVVQMIKIMIMMRLIISLPPFSSYSYPAFIFHPDPFRSRLHFELLFLLGQDDSLQKLVPCHAEHLLQDQRLRGVPCQCFNPLFKLCNFLRVL